MTDRQRRAFGWVAMAGLIVSAASIGFSRWANSPVSTSGIAQPVHNVAGDFTEPRFTAFSGVYFTADLPSNFSIKTNKDTPEGPIKSQMLFATQSQNPGATLSNQLAITIGTLPSGGIVNTSAVSLRQRSPDFAAESHDWLPAQALAFTGGQSEFEMSVFMPGTETYAAIVLTGSPNNKDYFTQVLDHVVSSWRWK